MSLLKRVGSDFGPDALFDFRSPLDDALPEGVIRNVSQLRRTGAQPFQKLRPRGHRAELVALVLTIRHGVLRLSSLSLCRRQQVVKDGIDISRLAPAWFEFLGPFTAEQ